MIKLAFCGKARSGKNTVANMFAKHLSELNPEYSSVKTFAFADPIKEMILKMFPGANKDHLYGPSEFRSYPIPGVYNSDQKPVTYRDMLTGIGQLGRSYCDTVWIDNLFNRMQEHLSNNKTNIIIVTDLRFINEFEALRNDGFILCKIKRREYTKINDISELQQDGIPEESFDILINNNKALEYLDNKVSDIVKRLFNGK